MGKVSKLLAVTLAAAMAIQTTVLAAPADELNEILTKQVTVQQETLLSKTLGLNQLSENIEHNGLEMYWKGGLTEGTAEVFGIQDKIPEGSYAELGFTVDKNAQNWLINAGFGTEESVLGNLALYGDYDRLSMFVPQLFVGALSLHAGNFKEQYEGSVVKEMIDSLFGEEYNNYIPELNTHFYPNSSDLNLISGLTGGFEEVLLAVSQDIENAVVVEKSGEEKEPVYTMKIPAEAMKAVYESVFEGYLSVFNSMNLMEAYETYDLEDQIDQMLDTMFMVIPREVSVDFYTKDQMLQKISYELYMDTNELAQMGQVEEEISYFTQSEDELETVFTDVVEGVLDEAGIVTDDMERTSEGFKGTVLYEVIFTEPSEPASGIEIHINMTDDVQGEFADFQIQMATIEGDTTSTTTVDMNLSAMKENLFSGRVYTQEFNAATGDWNVTITMNGNLGSILMEEMDPEELPGITLDSTFTEIDPGKAFTWVVDGLTMNMEGESVGGTTELRISAEPQPIDAPGQERVLLEMTEDEFMDLALEIMMNGQAWMTQFESEEIAVIGGADGPTSVWVAGTVE